MHQRNPKSVFGFGNPILDFFLKKCTLSVLDIHQLYKLQIEAVFKKGIVSFNAIAKPMKEN